MKAHLIDSDEPLIEGQQYQANCKVPVPSARFLFRFDVNDLNEENEGLSSVAVCSKCVARLFTPVEIKRYIYGIVPGQEFVESMRRQPEYAETA